MGSKQRSLNLENVSKDRFDLFLSIAVFLSNYAQEVVDIQKHQRKSLLMWVFGVLFIAMYVISKEHLSLLLPTNLLLSIISAFASIGLISFFLLDRVQYFQHKFFILKRLKIIEKRFNWSPRSYTRFLDKDFKQSKSNIDRFYWTCICIVYSSSLIFLLTWVLNEIDLENFDYVEKIISISCFAIYSITYLFFYKYQRKLKPNVKYRVDKNELKFKENTNLYKKQWELYKKLSLDMVSNIKIASGIRNTAANSFFSFFMILSVALSSNSIIENELKFYLISFCGIAFSSIIICLFYMDIGGVQLEIKSIFQELINIENNINHMPKINNDLLKMIQSTKVPAVTFIYIVYIISCLTVTSAFLFISFIKSGFSTTPVISFFLLIISFLAWYFIRKTKDITSINLKTKKTNTN